MDELSDNGIIGASPNNGIIDRSDQYGEILIPLHNVVAKKLAEKAKECRLDVEALYEIVLMQFWENADFRRASSKTVACGTERNLYRPLEAKCVPAIFKTQHFDDEQTCQELLTSYGIGLLNKPELAKLNLPPKLELAALV